MGCIGRSRWREQEAGLVNFIYRQSIVRAYVGGLRRAMRAWAAMLPGFPGSPRFRYRQAMFFFTVAWGVAGRGAG